MTLTGRALELFHLGEGPPDRSNRFHAIGRELPRVDGRAKVTGSATYAAKWPVAGLVHGGLVHGVAVVSAVARGTSNACRVRLRSLPYIPDKLIEARRHG